MSAAETSLVAKTFRMRLRSDPALGVADLMRPFQKMFDHHGSRDLRKVLDPPVDMDWKSSPSVKWLVKHKILFDAFLDIAPNTSVTSRKLKEALQRLHEKEPIHTSKKDDGAMWDFFDTKIRIGLAQLRELKHNRDLCFDRGMKKLSEDEQEVLRSLVEKIQFQKEDMMTGAATSTPPATSGGDSQELDAAPSGTHHQQQHAIVPVSAAAARCSSALKTPPTKSPKDAQNIFSNILQRKGIEDTPTKRKKSLKECTSSDPSTPDTLSLLSAKKKLRFDEDSDDDEQDQDDGGRRAPKIKILPKGKQIMKDNMTKTQQERGKKAARSSSSKGVVKGKKSSHKPDKSTSFFDSMLDMVMEESGEEEDDDQVGDDVVASPAGGKKLSSASQGKKEGGAHAKTADRKKTPPFECIDSASRLLYQGFTTFFEDCCGELLEGILHTIILLRRLLYSNFLREFSCMGYCHSKSKQFVERSC